MTAKKRSATDTWSNPDDAPPLTEELFKQADQYESDKLKPRGRPKAHTTKEPVKIRLDADVVAALRESGEGWQTRINDTLRASLTLASRLSARPPK